MESCWTRGDEPRQLNAVGNFRLVYLGDPQQNVTATAPDAGEHFRQLAQALIPVTAPTRKRLTSRYAHNVDGLGITLGSSAGPSSRWLRVCSLFNSSWSDRGQGVHGGQIPVIALTPFMVPR